MLLFSHLADRLGSNPGELIVGTFLAVFGPMAAFCAELFPTRFATPVFAGKPNRIGPRRRLVPGGGHRTADRFRRAVGPTSVYLVFGAAITIGCLALTGNRPTGPAATSDRGR